MSSLSGKKILLGITGSIAAYKAAYIVRLLVKEGCSVRVIMTRSSQDFISALTLSTLCKYPVATDVHDGNTWTNHVEWGLWADAYLIAPATAHTISRCAHGLASDMVSATYLSSRCPVLFAPAMDLDMWKHPATQENISRLQSYGNFIIDVGDGELASGLTGPGRMAEPDDILSRLQDFFSYTQDMKGVKVLVNAGPTHESIDPVRFIGNHSSGKMGVAIAEEFAERGAEVSLVLGPGSVLPSGDNIHITHVITADQMLEACESLYKDADVAILAAAIADYKPATIAKEKIKKKNATLALDLVHTPDIAAALGKHKKTGQLLVGFALETNNGESHAIEKLKAKNLDMIVLNNPLEEGAGFGHDTNRVSFLYPDNKHEIYELKSKKDVARDIAGAIFKMINTDVKN